MQSSGIEETDAPTWAKLALGPILCAVSLIGLASLWTDPLLHQDTGADPGPAFFPMALLALLGGGGVLLALVEAVRAVRAQRILRSGEFRPRILLVPVLLVLSLIAYARAIPDAGYVIATFIFAAAWLAIAEAAAGSLRGRTMLLLRLPAEAAVITGILYAGFRYGIQVPLP